MATESFYEDLVIDTPEAAERFTRMLEENKPYVSTLPPLKEVDEETLRKMEERYGLKRMTS